MPRMKGARDGRPDPTYLRDAVNACQAVGSASRCVHWPPRVKILYERFLPSCHILVLLVLPMRAQRLREFARTFFRKEQARAFKFDDFFAAGNGIAQQPTGPFYRE